MLRRLRSHQRALQILSPIPGVLKTAHPKRLRKKIRWSTSLLFRATTLFPWLLKMPTAVSTPCRHLSSLTAMVPSQCPTSSPPTATATTTGLFHSNHFPASGPSQFSIAGVRLYLKQPICPRVGAAQTRQTEPITGCCNRAMGNREKVERDM